MSDAEPIVVSMVEGVASGREILEGWDALACAHGRPMASPLWSAAWWRHLAPSGAVAHTVVCRRAGQVVGVLPLYSTRRRMLVVAGTLGGPGNALRGAALAADGDEEEVARAFAAAVRRIRPRPARLVLHEVEDGDALAGALGAALGWSARRGEPEAAPVMAVDPAGMEAWRAGKSANFRADVRRKAKRLAAAEAQVERVGDDDLDSALDAFDALHGARWGERSPLATPAGRAVVREAVRAMRAEGRCEVWSVTCREGIVAVHIFMRAGTTLLYFNGGWDPAWADCSPGLLSLVAAVEHAHEAGVTRFDLGNGDQGYKGRFADGDRPVRAVSLTAPGAQGAPARAADGARWAARAARAAARRARRRIAGGGHD
ncbi:MAG: GNAT family N-acetyltransferase [Miltoncostaeaceae bacterium]